MNEVIDIRKPKIDVDTIAAIEELLERAKSGDLKSLMYVDKYHNGGGCGYGWAGTPDITRPTIFLINPVSSLNKALILPVGTF